MFDVKLVSEYVQAQFGCYGGHEEKLPDAETMEAIIRGTLEYVEVMDAGKSE